VKPDLNRVMPESFHLPLLLLSLLGILRISWGLARLLKQGATTARLRNSSSSSVILSAASELIKWQETRGLAAYSRFFQWKPLQELCSLVLRNRPLIRRYPDSLAVSKPERLADPVDGTPFQRGETIARCACGTSYHLDSWQWLSTKNAGRCVNCKRSGPVSSVTIPKLGAIY
jgi:hypothetical protein